MTTLTQRLKELEESREPLGEEKFQEMRDRSCDEWLRLDDKENRPAAALNVVEQEEPPLKEQRAAVRDARPMRRPLAKKLSPAAEQLKRRTTLGKRSVTITD